MSLHGEMLEDMDHFKYLGSQIGREGGVEVDASCREGETRKMWKNGGLGVEVKMLHEKVVVPTTLYEGET